MLLVCVRCSALPFSPFPHTHHTQHTTLTPTRLDDALEQAAKSTTTTPSSSPLLLPADRPDLLVTVAWDAIIFSGAPAVQIFVAQALQAVAAAKKEEGEGGVEEEKEREAEVARLLEEGLTEAMAPFGHAVSRAWGVLQDRLVGQCAAALQGVKGITATYRMTNKRPPERACPYVAKVLDPIKALEPDVKGRCVSFFPLWQNLIDRSSRPIFPTRPLSPLNTPGSRRRWRPCGGRRSSRPSRSGEEGG